MSDQRVAKQCVALDLSGHLTLLYTICGRILYFHSPSDCKVTPLGLVFTPRTLTASSHETVSKLVFTLALKNTNNAKINYGKVKPHKAGQKIQKYLKGLIESL